MIQTNRLPVDRLFIRRTNLYLLETRIERLFERLRTFSLRAVVPCTENNIIQKIFDVFTHSHSFINYLQIFLAGFWSMSV